MNLPIILDIAIGLVFIYLIASLLASELQELLSSLLQWRAKHLKESIQNLLAGGQGTDKDDKLRDFLDQIYSDPLLKNMNQSARGVIGHLGNLFYQYIVVPIFYGGKNVFGGARSAPSYISPDTFATTLLEQIGLNTLVTKLTEIRLEKFMGRLIGLYDVAEVQSGREVSIPAADFFQDKDYRERGNIRVLSDKAKTLVPTGETSEWVSNMLTLDDRNPEFKALVEEYDDILRDFKVGEADLETCVERMKEGLDIYISQIAALLSSDRPVPQLPSDAPAPVPLEQEFGGQSTLIYEQPSGEFQSMDAAIAPEHHTLSPTEKQQLGYFKRRLVALRTGTFGEATERAIASGRLRPSLLEIAEVFDRTSMTYQEIEGAYQTIAAVYETEHIARQARKVVDAINIHIAALKKTKGSDQQALIATLPMRPVTIADLADPVYQVPLSKILPHLKPEIRQAHHNWEQYQASFAQIIQAIAAQLTAIGRLTEETIGSPEMMGEIMSATEPVGAAAIATRSPQPDLNTLRIRVNQILAELSSEELESLNQAIVAQLNPSDQKIYQGWQIFQRVILRVIRDIAQQLQGEGRFFDYHTRQEYAADLSTFDEIYLYQCVRYSLKLMSNEERQLRINAAVRSLNTDERKLFNNYQIYEQIQDVLATVPVSVKQSLAVLARRAQTRVGTTKNQLEQFNFEVSCWFDRSMGRASGVYKRNAKGVAILIGLLIAVISNIDTFHVVGRLSRDEDLRQVLITRASTVTENSAPSTTLSSREDLRKLREEALKGLETTAMPLGWNPENWAQQLNCEVNTENNAVTWKVVYETCLHERPAPDQFDLWRLSQLIVQDWKSVWSFLKVLLGWLISGVAIAMGAPFWFDLLSKFMNVRSTGTKPASVVDRDSAKPGS